MAPTDDTLRQIFRTTRVIACVGASPRPERPSHYVSRFLQDRGYRVIPVNPGHAGAQLFGETAVAALADITEPVDMIDVFRRSEHLLPIVEAALASLPGLRTVWMQIGVQNAEAAALAESHGLIVVQNRCPKLEYPRLFGHRSLREIAAA